MFEKLISEVRDKKEPIFNREGFLNFSIGGLTERISIILNVYPFEYKKGISCRYIPAPEGNA